METLGISDIAQLYNITKKSMIEQRIAAKEQSIRVMNDGHSPMTKQEIDQFAENCDLCLYRALAKLKIKYFGEKNDCHTWIGIDPSGQSMQELWDLTKSLIGRYSWVPPHEDFAFCVEQNTDHGIRPHVHLMLRGQVPQKPCYIAKKLGEYYGCASNFIDVKHFKRKRLFEEHRKYIEGEKKEGKMSNVEQDKLDRQNLGIPDYKPFT